uniref:Uncharacterized protein n=1 Tax=Escherichia coli TaxID=562 RepID=A0A8F3ESQ5_ECOLX|nr:hypothetical protein IFDMPAFH_00047 [Escherichia coli]
MGNVSKEGASVAVLKTILKQSQMGSPQNSEKIVR